MGIVGGGGEGGRREGELEKDKPPVFCPCLS